MAPSTIANSIQARALLIPICVLSILGTHRAAAAEPRDLGRGEVRLEVSWGSGGGLLAHRDADQSSAEGPMSFAVTHDGGLIVLDQVSARVVWYHPDGSFQGALPLGSETFQDLDVAADGRLVLVDRLVQRVVRVVDPASGEVDEIPVEGQGVEEGGGVTALLVRGDGVWLEYAHTHSVRVLDGDLVPCPRGLLPGRPARSGGGLAASLDPDGQARLWSVDRAGTPGAPIQVKHSEPITRLSWLEDDAAGNRILVFHVMRFSPDGLTVTDEYTAGHVYGPDGTLRGTFRSPYVITEWEQLREFKVGPERGLWQMAFTPEGVRFLRWELAP